MQHFNDMCDDVQGKFRNLQPNVETCNHLRADILARLGPEIAIRIRQNLPRRQLSSDLSEQTFSFLAGQGSARMYLSIIVDTSSVVDCLAAAVLFILVSLRPSPTEAESAVG